ANAPSQWEGLFLDRATASSNTNVHLVSAKAQAMNTHPSDEMDRLIPANQWIDSCCPGAIPWARSS
ncbi:MAG: hypothetical protein WA750_17180, partial [Pseudolabrys sp.]